MGFLILGGSMILSGMLGTFWLTNNYFKKYVTTNLHVTYGLAYATTLIVVTSVLSYSMGSGLPSLKQISLLALIGLGMSIVVEYVQKLLNNLPMLGK